ncbi:hypothetical protein [Halobacteriovorax sp. HLS]|uniref:hypothetical protein n=1 Tax=Halobacteriovorax sp. HLS TaxID=2234000 RepID=UPI000FD7290B|nr:hypothetical protein [Halobacteriovorax sp. HLS]
MTLRLSQLPLMSICLLFVFSAQGRILEYETTRLKSTAGAGVGSLLVEESIFLNPAAITFFNVSTFYFQKVNTEQTQDNQGTSKSDAMSFIAADTKGALKGAVAYTKQTKGQEYRQTIGGSMASAMGKTSSFGVSYQHIEEEVLDENLVATKEKYKKFTLGVTRLLSPSFTMGIVAIDPLRERPQDSKVLLGFQYVFQDIISLMLDGGADYKTGLSESLVWKTAAQVKFLDSFFLRFGTYRDKALKERGSGAGVSWVQPKLTVDVALKNSKLEEDDFLKQKGEKIQETSFSLSYRF